MRHKEAVCIVRGEFGSVHPSVCTGRGSDPLSWPPTLFSGRRLREGRLSWLAFLRHCGQLSISQWGTMFACVCVSETLPTFRNSDCQTPRLYLRDAKTLRMFRMMGRLEPRILGPGHRAKGQRGELNGVCLCEGQALGTELSPCLLFMAKVHHLRGLYIFTMILFFHIKED